MSSDAPISSAAPASSNVQASEAPASSEAPEKVSSTTTDQAASDTGAQERSDGPAQKGGLDPEKVAKIAQLKAKSEAGEEFTEEEEAFLEEMAADPNYPVGEDDEDEGEDE
jgi:hypothetical protein